MDMVDLRYPKIARVRARRIGDRERESAPTHESEVQYEERLAQRAAGMQEAFTHWLVQETRRNDRGWLLAAATPETVRITQRLFLAGVAQEGTTSEVEEDAQVGAQALHAGCRWIAADNSGMLRGEEFRDWLRAEHAAGRLLSAADPFRLTPDQAIGKMLGPRYETETAGVLTAIAWELIRPGNEALARDTTHRIEHLHRLARSCRAGGAPKTGRTLERSAHWLKANHAKGQDLIRELGCIGKLERTRRSEHRQVQAERAVIIQTRAPHPATQRDAGHTNTGRDRY